MPDRSYFIGKVHEELLTSFRGAVRGLTWSRTNDKVYGFIKSSGVVTMISNEIGVIIVSSYFNNLLTYLTLRWKRSISSLKEARETESLSILHFSLCLSTLPPQNPQVLIYPR